MCVCVCFCGCMSPCLCLCLYVSGARACVCVYKSPTALSGADALSDADSCWPGISPGFRMAEIMSSRSSPKSTAKCRAVHPFALGFCSATRVPGATRARTHWRLFAATARCRAVSHKLLHQGEFAVRIKSQHTPKAQVRRKYANVALPHLYLRIIAA